MRFVFDVFAPISWKRSTMASIYGKFECTMRTILVVYFALYTKLCKYQGNGKSDLYMIDCFFRFRDNFVWIFLVFYSFVVFISWHAAIYSRTSDPLHHISIQNQSCIILVSLCVRLHRLHTGRLYEIRFAEDIVSIFLSVFFSLNATLYHFLCIIFHSGQANGTSKMEVAYAKSKYS